MKKSIKRVVSVLVMCALVAMLSACGGKEESKTCTLTQDGSTVEIKIDAKGDIITKWTQTSTLSTEGLGEEVVATLEAAIDQMKTTYGEYSNVEYSGSLSGNSFVEVIAIDMTDKDGVQKLVDAGLLPVEGNASKLSMKQTVENLEKSGYVVQ